MEQNPDKRNSTHAKRAALVRFFPSLLHCIHSLNCSHHRATRSHGSLQSTFDQNFIGKIRKCRSFPARFFFSVDPDGAVLKTGALFSHVGSLTKTRWTTKTITPTLPNRCSSTRRLRVRTASDTPFLVSSWEVSQPKLLSPALDDGAPPAKRRKIEEADDDDEYLPPQRTGAPPSPTKREPVVAADDADDDMFPEPPDASKKFKSDIPDDASSASSSAFPEPALATGSIKKEEDEQDEEEIDDGRPVCQYDAGCYRKNPDHFKQFRHPALKKAKGILPFSSSGNLAKTGKKVTGSVSSSSGATGSMSVHLPSTAHVSTPGGAKKSSLKCVSPFLGVCSQSKAKSPILAPLLPLRPLPALLTMRMMHSLLLLHDQHRPRSRGSLPGLTPLPLPLQCQPQYPPRVG